MERIIYNVRNQLTICAMKLFRKRTRTVAGEDKTYGHTEEKIRDQQRQQPFGATRLHGRQQQQLEPSPSLIIIHS
jgi:hypothetical protein